MSVKKRAYTLSVKRRAYSLSVKKRALYPVRIQSESESIPCPWRGVYIFTLPVKRIVYIFTLSMKRRSYTLSVKKMAAKPFFWTELSERNSRRRLFPSEVITWTVVSSMKIHSKQKNKLLNRSTRQTVNVNVTRTNSMCTFKCF